MSIDAIIAAPDARAAALEEWIVAGRGLVEQTNRRWVMVCERQHRNPGPRLLDWESLPAALWKALPVEITAGSPPGEKYAMQARLAEVWSREPEVITTTLDRLTMALVKVRLESAKVMPKS